MARASFVSKGSCIEKLRGVDVRKWEMWDLSFLALSNIAAFKYIWQFLVTCELDTDKGQKKRLDSV